MQDQPNNIDSDNNPITLPKVPLEIDIENFEISVQKQFKQRINYINLLKKTNVSKIKNAWAIGQLGKTYHAYEKNDEARDCYLNAIFYDSENIEWLYLLAHNYKTTGDFKKSAIYFNKVLSLSDHTPAKTWLTDILIQQSDYKQAVIINDTILNTNPNNPMALYHSAMINIQFGNYKKAIQKLTLILNVQPQAYQAHYQLAQIYSMQGKHKLVTYHSQYIHDDSDLRVSIKFDDPLMQVVSDLRLGAQSIIKMARKASVQGYYSQAINLLNKVIVANPKRNDAVYNLATVYVKIKKFNKAKQLLNKIIVKESYADAYALLAKINKSEDNYLLAKDNITKALNIEPNNSHYLSVKGHIYVAINNFTMASEFYLASLGNDPDQELIQLMYIRALIQDANNYETAYTYLNNLVFSNKYTGTQYNILLRLALNKSIKKVNSLVLNIKNNTSLMALESKAMLSATNSNFKQAIILQNKALKITNLKTKDIDRIERRLNKYQNNQIPQSIWHADEALFNYE